MTSLKSSEFSSRSQTRFLPKRRTDAQCFGQAPDHCPHYQVLPNPAPHSLEIQGKHLLKQSSRMKEERKWRFFPVTWSSVDALWVGKQLPNQLKGREGNQPNSQAALADAEVKLLADRKKFHCRQEKLAKKFSASQATRSSAAAAQPCPVLLNIWENPDISSSSWAILGFLVPEATSGSSFLKLKEHWEYLWTFKSLFLIAATPLLNCARSRFV